MRYAILSDVHGNLEAFQAVLGDLAREGAERMLFLGDIVGYGANPKECIALLRENAHAIVAGNHDWAAVEKTDVTNFNLAARSAVEWTTAQLSSEETNFLAHLPLQGEEEAFIFVHATPLYPELWSYIFFEYDALQNLKALAQKACFIGHSHIPAIYSLRPSGELSYETTFAEVVLQGESRFLINVGSVGQPRDGNASAAYGIYDDEKEFFFFAAGTLRYRRRAKKNPLRRAAPGLGRTNRARLVAPSIADAQQEESRGGRGDARSGPVPGGKNGFEGFRRSLLPSYINKCSNDISHHMPQERICLDNEMHLLPLPLEARLEHLPKRRNIFFICSLKRRKVVPTH